ncbi:hypothetical protein JMJ35_010326 [Cladonia borealis]|uniref:Uncharacterized protein n=1 Tax=Cladonia borealis TaxID=184061 RepID=A0AA39QQI7_9LECA|nr:hypothetical protein JMJ35_010326 [Cladonia borealis]
MGNCGSSVNCTAVNQPTQANPDVAGVGVMVSFIATAIITFIAIVVGYLSDSLRDTSLSQLDRACIAKFSTIRWRPWIKDGPTSLLLRRSMTAAMGVLGWNYALADHGDASEDDDKSRDARERRSKGLEKFILALSDQQLVTGLAVLIAGFVSPCSMSIYHFNIIAALGWFSSMTHLSTLAVLRVYFIEHPRLRTWRVVAMLFVLVLLIIARVVTLASTLDNSLPVRCAFTHGSSRNLGYLSVVSIVGIMAFLVPTYSSSIVEQDKFRRKLTERQQYVGRELVKIVIESSKKTRAEQGVLLRSLNERRRYSALYDAVKSRKVASEDIGIHIIREIIYSFLGDIMSLYFGVALGITQVIVSRINEPSAGVVGSQNDINFGQLVPLLLMLLPLFAAGEVFFGNIDNLFA